MPSVSVQEVIKKNAKAAKAAGPLWRGPEKDGVTYSLLSRYLVCKERFRLLVIDGLQAQQKFNHYIGYGDMWHVCEEALAQSGGDVGRPGYEVWTQPLLTHATQLCKRYPLEQEKIEHWYLTCGTQFPCYVEHWAKHKDVAERTPLLSEHAFEVAYILPSGRTVKLRGKWDSVDIIGSKPKDRGIYIQENKTKGDIDESLIRRHLQFDLQTMIYLTAWSWYSSSSNRYGPPAGVRYNVVRRPFSGGKGSIKRHEPTKSNPKGESKEQFYARLRRDYFDKEPDYWFMRWKSEVSPQDIKRFRHECLDPVLENLCDDYEWWTWCHDKSLSPFDQTSRDNGFAHPDRHYRRPFGVYNVLDEGGSSELDEYLATGSTAGLVRAKTLFPELDKE